MRKFKAPEHTTAIMTFAGERRVDKKGVITLEDDATAAEIGFIQAAGWTEITGEPVADTPPAKAKAKA